MALKRHTGISFCLIGLLFPFLSSVCSASSAGNKLENIKIIDNSGNFFRVKKNDIPASNLLIKSDVDFINRIKNYRLPFRSDRCPGVVEMNSISHCKSLPVTLFSVPRPAYYNYLFMFKPFE